ncbi:N-acetylglucosamine-specific PTS transporter subunit IIBC [Jeotgalibaca porci]|uniref:N-acetylglucosamine-specific PTS transporter subunit IIBC n=1 Tax=Jeotgalibaca porci TaxID=1868793 RepID=UPI0016B3998F|nr:PTS transporter subunit EIIC [Lactobacillales bacterium]
MKTYFQRLGRSLMLPVAVLPAAAILMGIGYWIDPSGWGGESVVAAFLIKSGGALIDNMGILFAVGVALGMSRDRDGAAAISGLVAWQIVTTLLSPGSVSMLQSIAIEDVDPSFGKIQTQFIGILCGLIAGALYNKFHKVTLPQALAFFSGKRLVPIVTSFVMMAVSVVLLFVWPPVYNALVTFGTSISELGALGAGLYGFFNRLLIPTGLHHALNSVFWFDVANINDIGNFWSGNGTLGVTGMYQAGYFPVMMFGLPAGALAMYHTAREDKKKFTASLMIAAAFASFFTGVTEPLEFAFMFVAPALYIAHAVLTGISLFIAASFQWTAGFGFSAGLVDYILSFNLPLANKPFMLLLQGLLFAALYYFLFRFMITKFNLMTPGRGDDELEEAVETDSATAAPTTKEARFRQQAETILVGLGGPDNIRSIDNCATRLRLEIEDMDKINESKIKSAGVPGLNRVSKHDLQVIVGTEVQFVADELIKLKSDK